MSKTNQTAEAVTAPKIRRFGSAWCAYLSGAREHETTLGIYRTKRALMAAWPNAVRGSL